MVIDMARKAWTADPEHQAYIDAALEAEERAKAIEAAAKLEAAEVRRVSLTYAIDNGVPVQALADAFEVQRKTIYRHAGKPMK